MEDTDASASQHEDSNPQTVLVHIVSPSTEVPDRLTFSKIPLTTTISELKKRIHDAVPTKPTPERQRLIYRGRALGQQDLTLAALFGNEAVSPNPILR